MSEVPKVATPTTARDVTPVVASVYKSFEGTNPSGPTLAILLGQWDLETGTGRSTWNWNVGNLKAVGEQTFFVNEAVTGESNRFAAYSSLEAGVRAWLGLLAKGTRYKATWATVKAGDAKAFAAAIEASGYGGDPAKLGGKYAAGVLGRIQKYAKIASDVVVKNPVMSAGILLTVLGTLGFGAWWLWKKPTQRKDLLS